MQSISVFFSCIYTKFQKEVKKWGGGGGGLKFFAPELKDSLTSHRHNAFKLAGSLVHGSCVFTGEEK